MVCSKCGITLSVQDGKVMFDRNFININKKKEERNVRRKENEKQDRKVSSVHSRNRIYQEERHYSTVVE